VIVLKGFGERLARTLPLAKGELSMTKFVSRFMNDESGATAIEYGLIASLIAVAIIVAVTGLGTALSTKFAAISTSIH
jgi:pilus assembly protein Flp/PilA